MDYCITPSERLLCRIVAVGVVEGGPLPFQVISFLSVQYAENSTEHGFLFGQAFMQYHFGDRETGLTLIREFLNTASEERRYEPLVERAESILENDV